MELREGDAVRVAFDPAAGRLILSLDGIEPTQWARLGPNSWFGWRSMTTVSSQPWWWRGSRRIPGGKAQAAWLAEMGVEEWNCGMAAWGA
ncbi:MAG: hypothetical protein R3F17_10250 [Planctomycetota bacterium]